MEAPVYAGWKVMLLFVSCFAAAHAAQSTDVQTPRTWNEAISQFLGAFAESMSAKGYRLDYSIDSVREVERLFAEHAPNGMPKKGGMF